MMNKILKYIPAILGLLAFAISVKLFNTYFSAGYYTSSTWIAWLVSLALIMIHAAIMQSTESHLKINDIIGSCKTFFLKSYREKTLLLTVLLITSTVLFRWHNIENLPYGYKGMLIDTAYNSEVAFRITDGTVNFSPVLTAITYVRDSITHYYLSLFFTAFGKSICSLRLSSLILGIINVLLLFVACQMLFRKQWVSFGLGLLYACSATDTIFTYSSVEHVISTPLQLASFILLHKAVEKNNLFFYAASGGIIGLGLFSSYYFIILSAAFPIYLLHVAIFQFRHIARQYRGLLLFIASAAMATMPKVVYLIYNLSDYLMRVVDVSAFHNTQPAQSFLAKLGTNITLSIKLLFAKHPHAKWMLGENPIIDPILAPFIIVSAIVLLIHIRRPERIFIPVIIILSFAINVFSYPMDYRFMNTVPFFYMALGTVVLVPINYVRQSTILRAAGVVLGIVIIIINYNNYQNPDNSDIIRMQYNTSEMQVLSLASDDYKGRTVYYSIAATSGISSIFSRIDPEVSIHRVSSANGASRAGKTHCDTTTLYGLHSSVYRIVSQNSDHLDDLVFLLDGSACNEKIVKFLRGQLYFSESAIAPAVTGQDSGLKVLDDFEFFEFQKKRKKVLNGKRVKLKAIYSPPEKDMVGGILGVYMPFNSSNMIERFDESINFDWGQSAPDPSMPPDNFSVDWVGYLFVPRDGTYKFAIKSDDGSRLTIDETLVVDNWSDHVAIEKERKIRLEKGWHSLEVSYYEKYGDASIKLFWVMNGTKEIIPSENLCCRKRDGSSGQAIDFSPEEDLVGRILGVYRTSGSARSHKRFDRSINFDWAIEAPHPSISENTFTVDWLGYLFVPEKDVYTFSLESDDGSFLWIDETIVIDNWADHEAKEMRGKIQLEKGWHSLNVSYYERYGDASIKLFWVMNGTKEIIPSENLCCRKEFALSKKRDLPMEIKLPDYFFSAIPTGN